jgi:hypothetical protein
VTVDEFIAARVQPRFHDVVALIRQLMRETAPQAEEMIAYGIPAYKMKRIIAVISPTKKDITLAFARGAEFEDRYGLLQGEGKTSKNLKLKSVETSDKDLIKYYIRQAVRLDGA